jgi:hypothetical protein
MVREHQSDVVHGAKPRLPTNLPGCAGDTATPLLVSPAAGLGASGLCAESFVSSLSPRSTFRSSHSASLLQLQRQCGNRYVRRVVSLVGGGGKQSPCRVSSRYGQVYPVHRDTVASSLIRRQDGGDDKPLADKPKTPFPPDLPDTRYCTLDIASGKLNCCAEVAQGKVCLDDWGKFKDWLKGQNGPVMSPCPPGQTVSPVGCCPQGQTWDGTKCSAPSSPTFPQQCLPGEQATIFGTCCKPGRTMDSLGNPCPVTPAAPEEPQYGPGDYNVPDQDSNVAVA